jgi:hypothetical protein
LNDFFFHDPALAESIQESLASGLRQESWGIVQKAYVIIFSDLLHSRRQRPSRRAADKGTRAVLWAYPNSMDHGLGIADLRAIQERAAQQKPAADVRVGSKVDIREMSIVSRFTPQSGPPICGFMSTRPS